MSRNVRLDLPKSELEALRRILETAERANRAGLKQTWIAINRDEYLTANDVAMLFQVDLKTIHNWVTKERIPATRTGGGHLRILRTDVIALMEQQGYAVPTHLRRRP